MADNLTPPFTGSGQTGLPVETIDTGGIHRQVVAIKGSGALFIAKAEDAASADGDVGVNILAVRKDTPAANAGVGADADYAPVIVDNFGRVWTHPIGDSVTISSTFTRPSDTTAYAANDNIETSTSAPTSGGLTLAGAARVSGGSGVITDVIIDSSADPATTLQGEVWLFEAAVSANQNDNAAFALADADVLLLIAVIPFTLSSTVAGSGTNSYAHVQNLNIGFTCIGTADLRYKVKAKAAYTPISAEVFQVRLKILQTN